MKLETQHRTAEEPEPDTEISVKDDAEICQQLMSRYSTSPAPQHRHLLATTAAIRSILSAESLPLTPSAYFAAAIHSLSDSKTLDSTAVSALLSLVSILGPLIPEKGIGGDKAKKAVRVLVDVVVAGREGGLGVATVGGVVKSLGVLILGFCDLEVWDDSIKTGFGALLKFSIDKRPKVRRSAQDCLERICKSFQSSDVIKEASKLVHSLLKSYMRVALALCDSVVVDVSSKDETFSKPENLEVLHVLNLLKVTVPYLSATISSKILLELLKLMKSSHYTALTRHVLKCIEAFFETWRDEVTGLQIENIINCLLLYVSLGENPVDTVILAATMLKIALDKLHARKSRSWMRNVPKVCGAIAGLLTYEASTASEASDLMKELINHHMNLKVLLINENQSFEDASQGSEEADVIKSICSFFENILNSSDGIPNEHVLGVIAVLFQKLGKVSYVFMKTIVLKLADLLNRARQDVPDMNHLQDCIGSAVVAMGPKKLLMLVPISIDADNLTCSNIGLVLILKNHVVGASVGYYMEHIVPLAKSFEEASQKGCSDLVLNALPLFRTLALSGASKKITCK